MKFSGLNTKLISAFALLALLPLLLTGLISVYIFESTHEQDIATMERSLVKQKIEETQQFLVETIGLFDIRVTYENTSIISEADQKILLDNLLKENKYIKEAAFVDLSGMETSKLSSNQTSELMGLNNISGLEKFKIASQKRAYLGEVYQTQNGPMLSVALPVVNRSGQIIMVIWGEISLTPLKNIYSSATLGTTGYFYVIDQKNNIIGSSEKKLLGKNIEKIQSQNYDTLESRPGLLANKVLATSIPIEQTGWLAVFEWPSDDAFNVISNLRTQYLIFFLAVIILVLATGWLLGRRILKPLATLSVGAREFGRENFDYKIKINTGDEIQEFGNIMEKMAVDLKHHHDELEASHKKIEDNLREISKLKDDFIFVAAHELRSPVTVLQGYVAEMLEDKKTTTYLEKKDKYFLEMIKGIEISKDRLSTLVDDLLNIARMDAGKFKIDRKDNVDLSETVKPLLMSMTEYGKPRGITTSFKTKGKIPPLKVDPNRINELLTNLTTNAIKYNKDSGTVTITASFKNKRIYLEVADTGIGLDPEEQKHLFEKFWRSDEVNKIQGTGLGLFIVKHMIEQMGGSISFKSEKDKGTTFYFDLPAA